MLFNKNIEKLFHDWLTIFYYNMTTALPTSLEEKFSEWISKKWFKIELITFYYTSDESFTFFSRDNVS